MPEGKVDVKKFLDSYRDKRKEEREEENKATKEPKTDYRREYERLYLENIKLKRKIEILEREVSRIADLEYALGECEKSLKSLDDSGEILSVDPENDARNFLASYIDHMGSCKICGRDTATISNFEWHLAQHKVKIPKYVDSGEGRPISEIETGLDPNDEGGMRYG